MFDMHNFVPEYLLSSCFVVFCQSMHDLNGVVFACENMACVSYATGLAMTLNFCCPCKQSLYIVLESVLMLTRGSCCGRMIRRYDCCCPVLEHLA